VPELMLRLGRWPWSGPQHDDRPYGGIGQGPASSGVSEGPTSAEPFGAYLDRGF
jgi:hypothetical protein